MPPRPSTSTPRPSSKSATHARLGGHGCFWGNPASLRALFHPPPCGEGRRRSRRGGGRAHLRDWRDPHPCPSLQGGGGRGGQPPSSLETANPIVTPAAGGCPRLTGSPWSIARSRGCSPQAKHDGGDKCASFHPPPCGEGRRRSRRGGGRAHLRDWPDPHPCPSPQGGGGRGGQPPSSLETANPIVTPAAGGCPRLNWYTRVARQNYG
jgi:hypothetical protein